MKNEHKSDYGMNVVEMVHDSNRNCKTPKVTATATTTATRWRMIIIDYIHNKWLKLFSFLYELLYTIYIILFDYYYFNVFQRVFFLLLCFPFVLHIFPSLFWYISVPFVFYLIHTYSCNLWLECDKNGEIFWRKMRRSKNWL